MSNPGLARLRVIVGCHCALATAIGSAFFLTFGLFLKPMAQDLGWSRASISLAFSVITLGSVLSTVAAGYIVDRVGARLTALFATISVPALICALALATHLSWPAYMAVAVLMGAVAGFSSPAAQLSVVSRWFDARLGIAIALVTCGIGTGQIVNSLIAAHAIEAAGWRAGMYAVAGWCVLIGLGAWTLTPWRAPATAETPQAAPAGERTMLGAPAFWILTLAFMLVLLVTASVVTNVAAALSDRGLPSGVITRCLAIMGVASILARLVAGILLTWVPARLLGAVVFAAQGLGCVILATTTAPGAAYAAAFLVSFALGVEGDLLPFVIRRHFRHAPFGQAYGTMFGVAQLGAVVGPPLTALAYDRSGTYAMAFFVLAACSITASLALAVALTPQRAASPVAA